MHRSPWAALGAAVAVAIGGGGLLTASASIGSGERAVFVPITPCRLMDTRPLPDKVGSRSAPLGADDTHTIPVLGANGNCTIPADAVGLVLNVAVIGPTANSFLTVFPGGQTRPLAASANWSAGAPPLSNAVTTDIGVDGTVSFYNLAGTVNVAADVVGYFVDHHHDDRYPSLDHSHDARYPALVHSHDDRYYTEGEVDAKLVHSHDDRYFTEAEVTAKLVHSHDDRYFTEAEVTTRIAAVKAKASFGQKQGMELYTANQAVEVVRLTDAGGGVLTTTVPSRLVLTGAVTLGNGGATGVSSIVQCELQIDGGGGFATIGLLQGTETVGDSNHDEKYNIALTAAADRPAGTYNARILCTDTHEVGNSFPVARSASLHVIALPT